MHFLRSCYPSRTLTAGILLFAIMLPSCTRKEDELVKAPLENSKSAASLMAEDYCVDYNDILTYSAAESVPTILGDPLNGTPYSVENMKTAMKNLNPSANTSRVFANYAYVRIKPANEDQLASLLERDWLSLFDHPLDREVIIQGDYYPQPGIAEDELPWLYTVIDMRNVSTWLAGLNYEVLQNIHLPATQEIEDEALRITGNPVPPPCTPTNGAKASKSQDMVMGDPPVYNTPCGYRIFCPPVQPPAGTDFNQPAGWIRVRDKQTGADQGVPGATVVVRRWFRTVTTQTDINGQFISSARIGGKVNVLVKMRNSNVETRGIKGARFWQMWFPIKTSIGQYRGQKNNILYIFRDDDQATTNQHLLWFAATTLRAYADFNFLAASHNIAQAPTGMKILLTTHGAPGGGSTPMNRHRTNVGAIPQSFIEYFVAQPGTGSWSQLYNYLFNSKLLPGTDMSLGYAKANFASSEARELIYHELSHAAHFTQVGQEWWNTFVYAEASETARFGVTGLHSPYGDGAAEGGLSGYIAVGESWAYHIGHFFTSLSYSSTPLGATAFGKLYGNNNPIFGLSANLNALEDFDPLFVNYPFRWIPSGLYFDLLDERNENTPVVDGVLWYTNQQFFAALTSDVSSIPQFKAKLLLNSGNDQQAAVSTLFSSYGY